MTLTILATIAAQSGKDDLVRREILNMAVVTRTETGCVQYDLHEDNDTPGIFVIYEIWETRDLWQDHMKAPHLAAFKSATAGALESVTVREMTRFG